jgi:cytochrome c biogenesis protein CcmG/thiol:disulfide interchange protein DsbE
MKPGKPYYRKDISVAVCVTVLLFASASTYAAGDAPDFTLPDLDGRKVTMSKLVAEGPVILDFWATWCKPCLKGFPHLQALQDKYGDRGLRVVAISVDSPRSRSRVAPLINSKKYSFEVLLDTEGRVAKRYNAVLLPRTVLVDENGKIVYGAVGYRPSNYEQIEEALVAILPERPAGGGEQVE